MLGGGYLLPPNLYGAGETTGSRRDRPWGEARDVGYCYKGSFAVGYRSLLYPLNVPLSSTANLNIIVTKNSVVLHAAIFK